MPAVEDAKTLGRSRLSFADLAEIDEFVATLGRFEHGQLTPDEWRAFRLVRGTYGQRQSGDAQMMRVKIPQGVLDAAQLEALADVAESYSRGFGHITTRQNFQLHFVKLEHVEPAMRRLAQAGLTTREACGSAVRNVTGCPYAGVAGDEVFDVTPYAEALTRYFLRHPLSATLPRKFKIAFEGCPDDHALTAINDIGFLARVRGANGSARRGFRVTVGGGTSILCKSGYELFEFLPAGQILDVAEAVLRVFRRLGDYKHKQRNRMKFLIRELGYARWREEFESELQQVRAAGGARLPFDPEEPPLEEEPRGARPDPPSVAEAALRAVAPVLKGPGIVPEGRRELRVRSDELMRWAESNVRLQKQSGYALVTVTVPLGDLTGAQLRLLGTLALAYGDGSVRVTHDQNALFRWVHTRDVSDLYARLAAAGLGRHGASTLADVVSCPGAESCKLAVTQSRGLAKLLGDHLHERPHVAAAVPGLRIRISGCPNGCGQHHIAGLGFQGSVRRVGDKVVPQYFVMLGGGIDTGGARFGRIAAKVPARRVALAVDRLVALYTTGREVGESPAEFFRRVELQDVKALLGDLEQITPEDALPSDYVDLAEDAEFKVETQAGECSG